MPKQIILTGDRPTGNLHIGHFVGSLRNRVILQNSGNYEQFIMIADAQALTDNAENPEKIRTNLLNVALDYLAVGIDPEKSTILIQSQIPELTELTFYYSNLVTVARLQRNPTIKTEILLRGFEKSVPMGFLAYPISQTADITAFNANLVPVGEDQSPLIEQAREIVQKFNSVYGETLVMPSAMISENKHEARLIGTDGGAKMSKSLGNTIYLSDSEDVIVKKVMGMYTDPNHLKVEDPGNVEDNPVFIYLDIFAPDAKFDGYANLDELKEHYKRGGLGDVKVKKFLADVLLEVLNPIRKRREEFAKDTGSVMKMLQEGSIAARNVAAKTTDKVKKAMKLDYFA